MNLLPIVDTSNLIELFPVNIINNTENIKVLDTQVVNVSDIISICSSVINESSVIELVTLDIVNITENIRVLDAQLPNITTEIVICPPITLTGSSTFALTDESVTISKLGDDVKALIDSKTTEIEVLGNIKTHNESTDAHSAILGKYVTIEMRSIYDLPSIGTENILYFIINIGKTYIWDNNTLQYYCIGADYSKIDLINGNLN